MINNFIDWNKTTKSADYRGSGSFATFMIVGPTFFFLGILFASFPYDYPLLWTKDAVAPEYFDQLSEHLKFMHQAPPLIGRLLSIMIFIGFSGFMVKLYRPSEANFLFDGSSLILYFIGVCVYSVNIVKGLRTLSSGYWDEPENRHTRDGSQAGEFVLGRDDSLKVLAASNTILALVLVGVLVIQAGQWYAEKKDMDEDRENAEKDAAAEKEEKESGKQSKKKQ